MKRTRNRKSIPWQDRVIPEPNSGCLLWEGPTAGDYAQVKRRGKAMSLLRLIWQEARGPIPDGLLVCHRCDIPTCCNIDHFFLGTHSDNMQDMIKKGRHGRPTNGNERKTHCYRGHEFTIQNTRMSKGQRICRECARLNMAGYRAQKAQAASDTTTA